MPPFSLEPNVVRTATDLPSESDPFWVGQVARLMPFMAKTPRNWVGLKVWAKKKKIKQELLRNTVAWAENHGLVEPYRIDGKGLKAKDRIYWRAHPDWIRTMARIQSEKG